MRISNLFLYLQKIFNKYRYIIPRLHQLVQALMCSNTKERKRLLIRYVALRENLFVHANAKNVKKNGSRGVDDGKRYPFPFATRGLYA